jgi:hypothetical protein
MSRYLFLVLLLATFFALADDQAQAQRAADAAAAKPKAEAASAKRAQAQTKKAPKTTQAQPKAQAAQGQAEPTQAQTEKPEKPAEETQAQTGEEGKVTSVPGGKALGMSILGNQEAPKALVIVPWKTSELGQSPGSAAMLDDSRQPVDKEVFMRSLRYYEIRSEKKP